MNVGMVWGRPMNGWWANNRPTNRICQSVGLDQWEVSKVSWLSPFRVHFYQQTKLTPSSVSKFVPWSIPGFGVNVASLLFYSYSRSFSSVQPICLSTNCPLVRTPAARIVRSLDEWTSGREVHQNPIKGKPRGMTQVRGRGTDNLRAGLRSWFDPLPYSSPRTKRITFRPTCPSRSPSPLAASPYNHRLYLLPQSFLALLRLYSPTVMILRDQDATSSHWNIVMTEFLQVHLCSRW